MVDGRFSETADLVREMEESGVADRRPRRGPGVCVCEAPAAPIGQARLVSTVC